MEDYLRRALMISAAIIRLRISMTKNKSIVLITCS